MGRLRRRLTPRVAALAATMAAAALGACLTAVVLHPASTPAPAVDVLIPDQTQLSEERLGASADPFGESKSTAERSSER